MSSFLYEPCLVILTSDGDNLLFDKCLYNITEWN